MKTSVLVIMVSVVVLFTTLLWLANALPLNLGEYTQILIIGILVCFGLYIAYRRLKSEKRGLPAEDEFSKKVLQKSAAMSYYISLYLWLVIMYFTDKLKIETDVMFGWGILGMAIIFAVSWLFFNFRGLKNE